MQVLIIQLISSREIINKGLHLNPMIVVHKQLNSGRPIGSRELKLSKMHKCKKK